MRILPYSWRIPFHLINLPSLANTDELFKLQKKMFVYIIIDSHQLVHTYMAERIIKKHDIKSRKRFENKRYKVLLWL
jgi:hypothetical protein